MHLIVDSNYLFHRSRHALRDTSLSNEFVRTEIIFGFLHSLLSISRRYVIDGWSFVWDSSIPWRESEYPQYKAGRKALKAQQSREMSTEELELNKIQFKQMNEIRWSVLPKLGFKNNFFQRGAEGDDLIAQIVKQYPEKDFLIVATDKDLYQLLTANVSIYNGHKDKVLTYSDFIKKYDITPEEWGMAKCIGGCATDEVGGIKGCSDPGRSDKSRSLEYLRGKITKGAIYDRITSPEGQKIIDRNKDLVILPHRNTQPIELNPHSLFAKDFISVFGEYSFFSFLKAENFREWEYTFHLI